jgi:hypothetical protein
MVFVDFGKVCGIPAPSDDADRQQHEGIMQKSG